MAEFKSYTVKLDTVLDAKVIEAIEAGKTLKGASGYIRDQLTISLGMEPRQNDANADGLEMTKAIALMAAALMRMEQHVSTLQTPQTAIADPSGSLTPELFTQGIQFLATTLKETLRDMSRTPAPPITINMPPTISIPATSGNGHNGNGHHATEPMPLAMKANRPAKREPMVEAAPEPEHDEDALEAAAHNFLSMFG